MLNVIDRHEGHPTVKDDENSCHVNDDDVLCIDTKDRDIVILSNDMIEVLGEIIGERKSRAEQQARDRVRPDEQTLEG